MSGGIPRKSKLIRRKRDEISMPTGVSPVSDVSEATDVVPVSVFLSGASLAESPQASRRPRPITIPRRVQRLPGVPLAQR